MYRLLRRWWLVVCVGLSAPAVPFAAESRPQTLPWGEPDLQGTWTNATITGLERWEGFEQLALTEAAAREVETREADLSRQIDTFAEGDLPANIMVGGYNSAWLDAGDRVLRVNGEPRTSIINDPASGKVPYSLRGWLTMWWYLIRSQKRNNPEEQLVGDRCVVGFGSTGGPPMLPVLYNNNYRIVQTEGRVNILVEMNHAVRSIRIGGSHLPPQIRPWLGDSVGRWEGDTLVVETVQMHPQQGLSTAIKQKLFLGPDTVVTERFTRTAPEEIHYAFRVEDDRMFRRPWGGELVFRPSRGEIYEYACHEGNYGMTNMLAGERSHGVNGPGWLWRLVTRTPEEFTHPQLSGSRFAQ